MSTRAHLDKDPLQVSAMFDQVAQRYDLMNDLMSLGQDRAWRRATVAALAPRPGMRILDLAAGTGTSAQPLAAAGARVVAADLSQGMLRTGSLSHPELTFVAGDALRLPFADASFDAVTISFGLRNVPDPLRGLSELRRVTRPGGRVVICEFSTPGMALLRALYRGYLGMAMPLLARLSSNRESYQYLAETILAWPDQQGLAELMTLAGWRQVQWRNLSGGIVALHRGLV